MNHEDSVVDTNSPVMEGVGPDWAAFIQQQIQSAFHATMPHLVQQILERVAANLTTVHSSTLMQAQGKTKNYDGTNFEEKDSKVAAPEKFSGKRIDEIYKWFVQLRLVFRSKPHAYQLDEDKVAYALCYISGMAQN